MAITDKAGREASIGDIYSENIYMGWMEGFPTINHSKKLKDFFVEKVNKLFHFNHNIIKGIDEIETKLLPYRAIAVYVYIFDEYHATIIWFDNGFKDILEGLKEIMKDIDLKEEGIVHSF